MIALEGKVALITGGAQGLGKAIAESLTREGVHCILGDVQEKAALETAKELSELGEGIFLDVSDSKSIDTVIEHIRVKHKRLDIVINNAGIDVTKPIEELAAEEWLRVIAVNLSGPFLLTKKALGMLKEEQGQVINITSTAAKRTWPNATAYHASKWGLLGLSHALHAELRSQGVRVTAVVAGGMKTPFILTRFPDVDPAVLQDPSTVAQAVVWALKMPEESVIPEVMVLPMRETSWP